MGGVIVHDGKAETSFGDDENRIPVSYLSSAVAYYRPPPVAGWRWIGRARRGNLGGSGKQTTCAGRFDPIRCAGLDGLDPFRLSERKGKGVDGW